MGFLTDIEFIKLVEKVRMANVDEGLRRYAERRANDIYQKKLLDKSTDIAIKQGKDVISKKNIQFDEKEAFINDNKSSLIEKGTLANEMESLITKAKDLIEHMNSLIETMDHEIEFLKYKLSLEE